MLGKHGSKRPGRADMKNRDSEKVKDWRANALANALGSAIVVISTAPPDQWGQPENVWRVPGVALTSFLLSYWQQYRAGRKAAAEKKARATTESEIRWAIEKGLRKYENRLKEVEEKISARAGASAAAIQEFRESLVRDFTDLALKVENSHGNIELLAEMVVDLRARVENLESHLGKTQHPPASAELSALMSWIPQFLAALPPRVSVSTQINAPQNADNARSPVQVVNPQAPVSITIQYSSPAAGMAPSLAPPEPVSLLESSAFSPWPEVWIKLGARKMVDVFAGRKEEMGQIRDALEGHNTVIAVIGMAGQGKTSLISKWWEKGHEGLKTGLGVFWFRVYEPGYTFDAFLDDALRYVTGETVDRREHPSAREGVFRGKRRIASFHDSG
jgi:hypothetical protein